MLTPVLLFLFSAVILALRGMLTMSRALRLDQHARDVVDVAETIGPEVNASIPPRHNNKLQAARLRR